MADNTKNCPYSAGGTVRTCDTVRASNANAGCPHFDSADNTCTLANTTRRYTQLRGKKD